MLFIWWFLYYCCVNVFFDSIKRSPFIRIMLWAWIWMFFCMWISVKLWRVKNFVIDSNKYVLLPLLIWVTNKDSDLLLYTFHTLMKSLSYKWKYQNISLISDDKSDNNKNTLGIVKEIREKSEASSQIIWNPKDIL